MRKSQQRTRTSKPYEYTVTPKQMTNQLVESFGDSAADKMVTNVLNGDTIYDHLTGTTYRLSDEGFFRIVAIPDGE
jgi:hypothetical protein